MSTSANIDFKLSQGELARFLGRSQETICAWTKKGYLTKPQRVSNRLLYSVAQVRRDVAEYNLPVKVTDDDWPQGT